jgi:hypothetical protein
VPRDKSELLVATLSGRVIRDELLGNFVNWRSLNDPSCQFIDWIIISDTPCPHAGLGALRAASILVLTNGNYYTYRIEYAASVDEGTENDTLVSWYTSDNLYGMDDSRYWLMIDSADRFSSYPYATHCATLPMVSNFITKVSDNVQSVSLKITAIPTLPQFTCTDTVTSVCIQCCEVPVMQYRVQPNRRNITALPVDDMVCLYQQVRGFISRSSVSLLLPVVPATPVRTQLANSITYTGTFAYRTGSGSCTNYISFACQSTMGGVMCGGYSPTPAFTYWTQSMTFYANTIPFDPTRQATGYTAYLIPDSMQHGVNVSVTIAFRKCSLSRDECCDDSTDSTNLYVALEQQFGGSWHTIQQTTSAINTRQTQIHTLFVLDSSIRFFTVRTYLDLDIVDSIDITTLIVSQ